MITQVFIIALMLVYSNSSGREKRSISDPEIINAAEYALVELSKLSDTGIYKTLSLNSIQSADSQLGVFHYNIYLKLRLSSPYLKSKRQYEEFDVMVMKHLENEHTNFAINEFPVMEDSAIEEYWIQMVDEHRSFRDKLFHDWEKAVNMTGNNSIPTKKELKKLKAKELRELAAQNPLNHFLQNSVQDILDERWEELAREESRSNNNLKDEL